MVTGDTPKDAYLLAVTKDYEWGSMSNIPIPDLGLGSNSDGEGSGSDTESDSSHSAEGKAYNLGHDDYSELESESNKEEKTGEDTKELQPEPMAVEE